MTSAGWSTLDVIPSVKNFRSQLERQTNADLTAAGRRGGERFGDAAGTAAGGRFKTKFGALSKGAFAPLAGIVAGAGIIDFFKGSISGASDLAESGNKVKVVFGDATDEVEKFASRGAKAFGQTKLDVLNAAAGFGVFGKAAGLSGTGLADFSDELAGLSTDLASFFNTSPAQAVEAIGAGLRGESEPLRQFGVLLDDATLRSEALRLGLTKTTTQALTPQQRVLAAYNVILAQTTDAQGDFERTSGGLANQQRILSAQWSEMRTELGSHLLPAATATVKVFNDGIIPAAEGAGGAVAGAARFFNGLPGPVKAATGALLAFRAASALGAGGLLTKGSSLLTRGLDDVRLRAMSLTDEYKRLRQGQLEIIQGSGKFTPAMGRVASALGAAEVAAIGAGRGIRSGLRGAVGLVGGPWGAAFIAGTAIVAHFWQEHLKAKQRVEDFTATLSEQTGALTENSREFATKALLDAGALAAAERLGVSLSGVTDAALGSTSAMSSLSAEIASRGQLEGQAAEDAITLKSAIDDQSGVVQEAISGQKLYTTAMGSTASQTAATAGATQRAGATMHIYAGEMKAARAEIQKLLDKENERRNKLLGQAQDQLALADATRAARKEATEGKKTLDLNTEAGSANRHALFDLAQQWNDSADKVRNAKGAYADMRQNFIEIAEKMGATKGQAQRLADRLLSLPKRRAVEITTPGMKAALEALQDLKNGLLGVGRIVITAQAAKNQAALSDIRKASGGPIYGPGSGTSDSILMWGSNGEFMQPKATVDYYGMSYMEALRRRQLPRYATGGPIGTPSGGGGSPLGHEIIGTLRLASDGTAYIDGVTRRAMSNADAAKLRAKRASGIGGVPV